MTLEKNYLWLLKEDQTENLLSELYAGYRPLLSIGIKLPVVTHLRRELIFGE